VATSSHLEQWEKERAAHTREQFRANHAYPFLVWSSNLQTSKVPKRPSIAQMSYKTQIETIDDTERVPHVSEITGIEDAMVWAVRKAANSPFPDRVSIGRAANCDIVVRDSSVSKLHAHLWQVTSDSAVVTDAKSANGTCIDGRRIATGSSDTVSEFGALTVGRVRLVLLSAGAVYDWLGQVR
jgi:hypothetical protein